MARAARADRGAAVQHQHGLVDQSLHFADGRRDDERRWLRRGLVRRRRWTGRVSQRRARVGRRESPAPGRNTSNRPCSWRTCGRRRGRRSSRRTATPSRMAAGLFVHNGLVNEFPQIRRELMVELDPESFAAIQGSADIGGAVPSRDGARPRRRTARCARAGRSAWSRRCSVAKGIAPALQASIRRQRRRDDCGRCVTPAKDARARCSAAKTRRRYGACIRERAGSTAARQRSARGLRAAGGPRGRVARARGVLGAEIHPGGDVESRQFSPAGSRAGLSPQDRALRPAERRHRCRAKARHAVSAHTAPHIPTIRSGRSRAAWHLRGHGGSLTRRPRMPAPRLAAAGARGHRRRGRRGPRSTRTPWCPKRPPAVAWRQPAIE